MTRTKKTWLITALVLGSILTLLITSFLGYSYIVKRDFERAVAALRTDGRPTCIADLELDVDEDDNAALLLLAIKPDAVSLVREIDGVLNPHEGEWDKLSGPEWAAIGAALVKYPHVMNAIREATTKRTLVWADEYSRDTNVFADQILDNTGNSRTVQRVIRAQMQRSIHGNNHYAAIDFALQGLQLVRLAKHEPTIVSLLVDIAIYRSILDLLIDILRDHRPSDEQLAELEKELMLHKDDERLKFALQTELAFNLDFFRETLLGPGGLSTGWWFYKDATMTIYCYRELEKVIGSPKADVDRCLARLTGETSGMQSRLTHMNLQPLSRCFQAWFENQERIRDVVEGCRKLRENGGLP